MVRGAIGWRDEQDHQLDRSQIDKIVQIQFGHVQNRAADQQITLSLTPEAATWLARQGYDPSFGARPLKRLLQREVADQLALRMLEGEFGDGDIVSVVVGDDGLDLAS